ncbi:MAG: pirin family protein [Bacteroidetes bacterium]|nr:pirin family protein [Bacteroidota bacterium]
MLKPIINIFPAANTPMDNLPTWRALPSFGLAHLDPFIFINHHGPATFEPHNPGLPFGPHPHRGFETLTFVFEGEVYHRDSHGGEGVIRPGGVQWMTAGRGIIHTEISSKEFQENGGNVHLVQIWMNLPPELKMTAPGYQDLDAEKIIQINGVDGKSVLHLISGDFAGKKGPAKSITNLFTAWLEIKAGGTFSWDVEAEKNIMFYIVNGEIVVNGNPANTHKLVQFSKEDGAIEIDAKEDSIILLGHGTPFNAPIVAQGPFVMNSDTQILEAMRDYRMGKMGVWID